MFPQFAAAAGDVLREVTIGKALDESHRDKIVSRPSSTG
jgi:hypothetical protein